MVFSSNSIWTCGVCLDVVVYKVIPRHTCFRVYRGMNCCRVHEASKTVYPSSADGEEILVLDNSDKRLIPVPWKEILKLIDKKEEPNSEEQKEPTVDTNEQQLHQQEQQEKTLSPTTNADIKSKRGRPKGQTEKSDIDVVCTDIQPQLNKTKPPITYGGIKSNQSKEQIVQNGGEKKQVENTEQQEQPTVNDEIDTNKQQQEKTMSCDENKSNLQQPNEEIVQNGGEIKQKEDIEQEKQPTVDNEKIKMLKNYQLMLKNKNTQQQEEQKTMPRITRARYKSSLQQLKEQIVQNDTVDISKNIQQPNEEIVQNGDAEKETSDTRIDTNIEEKNKQTKPSPKRKISTSDFEEDTNINQQSSEVPQKRTCNNLDLRSSPPTINESHSLNNFEDSDEIEDSFAYMDNMNLDINEQLILAVEERRQLWDRRLSPGLRTFRAQNKLWREIADIPGIRGVLNVDEIKEKWDCLLDTYRKLQYDRKKSKLSSAPKKPKWIYHNIMSFTDDKYFDTKNSPTCISKSSNDDDDSDGDQENIINNKNEDRPYEDKKDLDKSVASALMLIAEKLNQSGAQHPPKPVQDEVDLALAIVAINCRKAPASKRRKFLQKMIDESFNLCNDENIC
ncbi:hypothetical protein HCN44_007520 [Aphidius gifuensis]|uniref:MADF domain-containing protein n=1 Tax=Aphidius gifuensis TaxID=684658 RepID=A0A834XL60_APHGI|nr:interaptin-like isoform X2 [Aphidius gifuensis]KAF7988026.1 hypothetical protein HCN44_007520 [Aphidius gifuensis]